MADSTYGTKMRDLLALSDLKRWNVVPTTRDQSVAQHSFRVAIIALEIAERVNLLSDHVVFSQERIGRILRWSLMHDGPECLTGDLPTHLKTKLRERNVDVSELEIALCPWYEAESGITSVPEEAVVGIADVIESAAWISQFGTPETLPIQDELKRKASARCHEAGKLFDLEHVVEAGFSVMEEVWANKIPMLLDKSVEPSAGRLLVG